ncbi:hypothetical protein PIIN_07579 [Serendipita indica DSM 11827]|uniref:Uncharacterized protein n=2 Tax=Serendipita indica (strain DSM 11827) TaxID=1109443 RepID=G4TQN3_SERID|nr:hypothetical protein PIIN_07579 [Serendipita indica DSM 11827]
MALAIAVYSLSARAASNTTEHLPSCANQYRSLPGIALSCLTTIFLCIWVALHLNVPEPVDTRGLGHLQRLRVWIISFTRCTVVPIFVTLVFPEWVLGMAILQFRKATELAKKLRKLQSGKADITRQHGFFILMGGFHLFERGQNLPSDKTGDNDREDARLLVKEPAVETGNRQHDQASKNQSIDIVEEMGRPAHPLDEFDVLRLIEAGKLRLPPSAELQDRCKSDALAKFLVIVQTLWFTAQCVAREASKLPLTELEVITLGYTLLTIAMYLAWWDKPYRVTFPIRVYETLPERTKEQNWLMIKVGRWDMALNYAAGVQGAYIELRSVKRVPMFHSGYMKNDGLNDLVGLITTISVGTLFGAVHFLAWSSPFPSNRMQLLWRFATIVMTAVPPALGMVAVFAALAEALVSESLGDLIGYTLFLLPPLYFIGRGITIVLALMTLATLPLDAYRDVAWSDFFPHI